MFARFTSRKFLLALAALIYSVYKNDPKWAALASAIYTLAQGYIDVIGAKAVVQPVYSVAYGSAQAVPVSQAMLLGSESLDPAMTAL